MRINSSWVEFHRKRKRDCVRSLKRNCSASQPWIARAANQGQLVTGPGRGDLTAMLRVCGTLRDSLKRVLLANLKSWEQGSPQPPLGDSNRPNCGR
jgi:hypothetical protein